MKAKTQKRKEALARREKNLTAYKQEKEPTDLLRKKITRAESDIAALQKKLGK